MANAVENQSDQFVYYLSEGAVMRQAAPGGMTEPVQVWFPKKQQWADYNDVMDFWHTATKISESDAKSLMQD